MKDFVQHRLALERAWQDTIPCNLDDTESSTQNKPPYVEMTLDEIGQDNRIKMAKFLGVPLMPYEIKTYRPAQTSYIDDLYSDIVWFCTLVYVWLLLYLIFTR